MKQSNLLNIGERVAQIIDHLKINTFPKAGLYFTQKELSNQIDMAEGNITNAKKGNPKYINAFFDKVNSKYPDIFNKDWYLTGDGDMLKLEIDRPTDNANFSDLSSRIRQIMQHERLNISQFAEKTGIGQGNLSSMLNGNRTIGEGVLNKIIVTFEDINKDWLFDGQGEMLKSKHKQEAVLIENPNIKMIPLVSQYAHAGYLGGFADAEYMETLPKIPIFIDHELKGNYIGFEVKGDSMDDNTRDSIAQGDVLACREIKRELWQYKLHYDKWDFVIVHKTEGILVKRITNHNTSTGDITIHSLNPMYEDRVLNLDDVAQLFNVVQVIREMRR